MWRGQSGHGGPRAPLGILHLLRHYRIYDPEPPEVRTPGCFYSPSGVALDIAAASAPLDACRTLLRAVVRDAGAMGHSLDFVLRDALAAAVGADRPAVAAMLVDAIVAHAPNHVDHNSARVRLGFAGEYSNIPFQVYGLLLSPASDLDKAARLSGWLAVTVFCAGAAYAVAAMCLHTRRLPRQGLSQTYWTELQLTKALVQGKAYVARAVMARGISESALGTPVALWRGEAWLLRARLPETAFFTIVYIANAYSFLPSSTEPNQSRLWLACVWVFVGGLSLYPLLVCWCLLRYACKRVQKWWPLAALGKGKRGKHVKPE